MPRKTTVKSTKIKSLENLDVYGNHGMYISVNSSLNTQPQMYGIWHAITNDENQVNFNCLVIRPGVQTWSCWNHNYNKSKARKFPHLVLSTNSQKGY